MKQRGGGTAPDVIRRNNWGGGAWHGSLSMRSNSSFQSFKQKHGGEINKFDSMSVLTQFRSIPLHLIWVPFDRDDSDPLRHEPQHHLTPSDLPVASYPS